MTDSNDTRISVETKKEIERALHKLTTVELYEVIAELKMLIQRDKNHVINLLQSKPVLAQALLTAQIILGMAQITDRYENRQTSTSDVLDIDYEDELEQPSSEELIQQILRTTPDELAKLSETERQHFISIQNQFRDIR